MSTKWTKEQKEAIFTKNCNLLVAAGAGAGKTAVLVERIIQRVTDKEENVDIDRLLVVTFTNAAASEMRERVGDAISRELELNPDSKNLQRQLTLLNQSNIMTIHSFCLQVIKSNFYIIDLDPNFRVCDTTEAILLKRETLEELFEDAYEKSDNESFLNLVDSYGGKNDFQVQNMVLSLYEFAKSSPWPRKWLTKAVKRFNVEDNYVFGESDWARILVNNIKIELYGCKNKMEKAIEIIENSEGIEYYLETFKNDLEKINKLYSYNSWEKLKEGFITLEFEKLPIKKNKDADKEAKEKTKKVRDEVKKKLIDIADDIFLSSNNTEDNLKDLYPMMKCLVDLVIDFDEKYSAKKRERSLIDFNDIEHFCLGILTEEDEEGNVNPSKVAVEYKEQFEEILIDEYQDSNEVQEVIMNMIANKNDILNMFMVGDVKQSIYRFRQAKPELFLNKYNTYSEEKESSKRKIRLFKNFRSRVEVIDGVNYLFKQIMSKNIGELDYGEEEALTIGSTYLETEHPSGGEIELHLIDKKSNRIREDEELDSSNNEAEEILDNIQIEARLVARKINELINSEDEQRFHVYDKSINSYRPVRYKDIVILMRATANWAPTFVDELNKIGIPVFADTATGYFDTIEIRTIMSLLQVIDNPMQDIPLISVLRSPLVSFLPEDLIDIRMVNKHISFYEALKSIYEYNEVLNNESLAEITKDKDYEKMFDFGHISEEIREKACNFIKRIRSYRKKAIHMPIDEFIWYLYTETGYYGFVGAMPGGKQRQANLRVLFERAKQYEKTSYKGLFNFIDFINKIRNNSGDMGSAKILGENEDVVRIMSIHKSKGLEFPVVILSGCGKNFNMMDMNRSILFHGELGLGPDYVNLDRRISYPTIIKQVLKKKMKLETLSEEMRVLYVAFTRAKEKLIITGMVNNIAKSSEKWCEAGSFDKSKIPDYFLLNAKSYLDWIGPSIAKHEDGSKLRECAGYEYEPQNIIKDNSLWSVKLWNNEDFKSILSENLEELDIVNAIESITLNEDSNQYNKEIQRRLDWEYKYKEACSIPAKFSVSELKRRFSKIDTEESFDLFSTSTLKKPLFLQKSMALSPSERGTVLHLVMQHINLEKVFRISDIKEQIDKLVLKEFITEEEAKVIDMGKILRFFESDVGKRMLKAKKVYREVPFFMELPCKEIYKELTEKVYKEEKVMLQGIIDCYFEEDGDLVLLDYKTDYVKDISEIKERYKLQIYYYAKALESMTGKLIKSKYLYLFSINKILEM
ncbi:helicase-exonuclease AddAB subunit AddA [Clostridium thailandense]|uniref:helicase-exonuclease AddAB subunit AddA n=1 Tax=Clostridium thailandense TaxID=2794346 RepID=UPI0039896BA9